MRTTKRAPKDTGRRVKKKPCQLCKDRVEWVDYKNSGMLKRYMSERGKIRARRVSGNCEQHQREIAEAIKTARELALLPYTQRTVTERRGGGRGRDREGGGRGRPPRGDEETTLASGPEDERTLEGVGEDAPTAAPVEAAAPAAPAAPESADAPDPPAAPAVAAPEAAAPDVPGAAGPADAEVGA
jgi:small subunit ribosomal protein S18